MDEQTIADALERASDRTVAYSLAKNVQPLKGVRGVPNGEIAKVLDAAWKDGVDLLSDDTALSRLFGAAFEDGLVAVGLLAAATPDDPQTAWEIASEWVERVDDPLTADAIGGLVLGPAALAGGLGIDALIELGKALPAGHARRAAVAAGDAMLPDPADGPAVAGLRARLGTRQIRFVEAPLADGLGPLLTAFFRDPDPSVQKAVRRLIRGWGSADPVGLTAWADTVRGGFPKLLSDDLTKARRKAARLKPDGDDEDDAG